jgi:hypothetical protein
MMLYPIIASKLKADGLAAFRLITSIRKKVAKDIPRRGSPDLH